MTKSHLPYLPRNFKAGIQAAVLGMTSQNAPTTATAQTTNGHDDHYVRPAKRRRFMESSPDSGIGQEVGGFVLHEDPVDIPRAMKINVLRLVHKDLSRAKQTGVSNGIISATNKEIETRARCKISITTPGPTSNDTQLLYCHSQVVNIRTSQDADGICRTARVELPQRFDVPEEMIYVERVDDTVFDLADVYAVKVELQSAGDDNWPPLNLAASGIPMVSSSARHWTLEAEIENVLERNRRLGAMKLCRAFGFGEKTDFYMDIDVRWATALPAKHVSTEQERILLPSIANGERDPLSLTNGHVNGNINGHLTNGHSNFIDEDLEQEAEGELTPGRSRSLRVRGSTNYNLKELSAKAQGRAPRKRAKLTDLKKADSERVLYRLPKEAGPVKEVVVDGFSCCVCHAAHDSLAQLRAHLLSHTQYKFELNAIPGRPGLQLDVSCVADNSGGSMFLKAYQLGKPTKAFDLDKYVEGDDSWVTSRLGPNNDICPVAVPGARKNSQSQTKPSTVKAVQRIPGRRKEKKITVPETAQPLFDPLSKAKLVPGSEVRRPPADESWLVQKHRDIVQDFCDVDAAEKEYIKEWDAFIQKKRIVSEALIGRAVVEFVHEKVNWLLDSQSRTLEFGKHLTVLLARGLDEDTVRLVQGRLLEARLARSQKLAAGEKLAATEPSKEDGKHNSGGCAVCGRVVRGPSLLICANENCEKPMYHDDCIRETARMDIEHPRWQCNDCVPSGLISS